MSYEEPPDERQMSLYESISKDMPLHCHSYDRQQWAVAVWAMEDLRNRQIYLDEALTPAVWLEILLHYQCGDLSAIGLVIDKALRSKMMCDRVEQDHGK